MEALTGAKDELGLETKLGSEVQMSGGLGRSQGKDVLTEQIWGHWGFVRCPPQSHPSDPRFFVQVPCTD